MIAIQKLHEIQPLDKTVLIDRYLNETGHATGNQSHLDQNFALLINYLYGQEESEEVLAYIRQQRKSGAK